MRRIVITVLATSLALTLTSCGAGFNASTREVKQRTDGAEGAITTNGNSIKILNLLVVATAGGTGVLIGTLVNTLPTEDTLLGIAVNGTVMKLTGLKALKQNAPIRFEGDTANAKAILPALNALPGTHLQATLFFAHAGKINFLVLVRDQSDTYAGITP